MLEGMLARGSWRSVAIVATLLLPAFAPACSRHRDAQRSPAPPFNIALHVDTSKVVGPSRAVWRYLGADEPNYAYATEGTKLLGEIGSLTEKPYFRAHNMLTTGDGTPALKWGSTNAYTENATGQPIYDWTITDRIFDTYS